MRLNLFIVIAAFIVGLFYLSAPLIMPLFLSVGFTYILEPAVTNMVVKLKIQKTIASLLVTTCFFSIFIALLSMLGPMIYLQISLVVNQVVRSQDFIHVALSKLPILADSISPQIKEQLYGLLKEAAAYIILAFKKLLQSSAIAADVISLFAITPVITFYLLKDSKQITQAIQQIVPGKYSDDTQTIFFNIQKVLLGFFRGQFIVCAILIQYYAVGFLIIGLKSWLGLGVLFGVLAFIPYLGFVIATIICLAVGIMQFGFEYYLLTIITVLIIGQFLEGFILTPKFVGERVGLHPLFIIFSLLIGWHLMGIVGMLLAIPFAAIIGVLIRFSLIKYRNSEFYNQND